MAERDELYQQERVAVDALRRAAAERAPADLRMRIEALRQARPVGRRRAPAFAALAGALACAAAALILLLPGGAPGSPSVSQAAQLALRGAAGPAPGADPGDPGMKLAARVQGLYFPNWSATLGWRPAGVRTDQLGGRQAVTVYYERDGMRVAYTIVATPALAQPTAPVTRIGGLALQAIALGGRHVVTWRRAGHTCVLSASGVPAGTLEELANWRPAGVSD